MKLNRSSVLLATAFSLVLFWQIPFGIFNSNSSSLPSALAVLNLNLVLFACSFMTLLALFWVTHRFPRVKQALEFLFCFLTLYFWSKANLLQWHVVPPDGSLIDWTEESAIAVYDLTLTFAIVLVVRWLAKQPKWFLPVMTVFSLAIFSDGLVNFLKNHRGAVDRMHEFSVDHRQDFRFSKTKNIFLVVWDEFQSDIFEKVLKKRPDLKLALKDFTFYPDTSAGFKFTSPSIPLILSGEVYQNDKPFSDYLISSFSKPSSFVQKLKQAGFVRHLWPTLRNTYYLHPQTFENAAPTTESFAENLSSYVKIYELSMFLILPGLLDRWIYSNGDWALAKKKALLNFVDNTRYQKVLKKVPASETAKLQILSSPKDPDYRALDAMTRYESASTDLPIFKFYHFDGAHIPFNIDEEGKEQIRRNWAETETLYNYEKKVEYKIYLMSVFLDILKNKKIYANSLIIFLGDHGMGRHEDSQDLADPDTGQKQVNTISVKARANPFLIVKPFQVENPEMLVSKKSISLHDIQRIALSDKPLERELDFSTNVRRYVSSQWMTNPNLYLKNYNEWIISGHVRKDASWTPYHVHEGGKHTACIFENYDLLNELDNVKYSLSQKDNKSSVLSVEKKAAGSQKFLGVLLEFYKEAKFVRITQGEKVEFAENIVHPGEELFISSPFLVVNWQKELASTLKFTIEVSESISDLKRIRFFNLSPKNQEAPNIAKNPSLDSQNF